MSYTEFAERVTKLYPRYFRYYVEPDEGYEEDSATETEDGSYPEYTEKYRERDRKHIDKFLKDFSESFIMFVCNERYNTDLKITWKGDLEEFYDYLYAIRGNRHVFVKLEFAEMKNAKPWFRVIFN